VPDAEQHAIWFRRTLSDPMRLLMIVEREDKPSGMVRLDRLADSTAAFEVSIAVSEEEQGRGIGLAALKLARRVAATDLLATVLPGNSASNALFLAAGYSPDGDNRYRSRAA
jgi:RimJ/RimL family protein N-acetyltransferase